MGHSGIKKLDQMDFWPDLGSGVGAFFLMDVCDTILRQCFSKRHSALTFNLHVAKIKCSKLLQPCPEDWQPPFITQI